MRNMKTIFTKLACFLLALFMSGAAMAESITSPDGQLRLNFSVKPALFSEPAVLKIIPLRYGIFFKNQEVIENES